MTGSFHSVGHVEALVDLALIGRAVAEIGQADAVVAAIFVGEGKPGAERHLGADDAVAAVEILLDARTCASSRPCPWNSRGAGR